MLKRSADAIVKWKGFDQAIDRWLDERHKLILQLSDFAADHNFSLCTPEVEDKLRAFIAQLIDYVSAGHFEFYQRLVDEGREFDDVEALANIGSLLEAIDISTQCALDFNEKYEQIDDLSECVADISDLAESLVTRFDAEDQMINSLHRAHLRQITA
jgi:regulator of sigma D